MKIFKAILVILLGVNFSSAFALDDCKEISKIPSIDRIPYSAARKMVSSYGWHPMRLLISGNTESLARAGATDFINQGDYEIVDCEAGGSACTFVFRDKFGNILLVDALNDFEHKVRQHKSLCLTKFSDWDDRAAIISKLLIATNSQYLAEKIQKVTHPSGSGPSLKMGDVAKYGNKISADIIVEWHGGFSGNLHKTVIGWTFDKDSQDSISIKSDSAPFGVASANLNVLKQFFDTELYPLAREALAQ